MNTWFLLVLCLVYTFGLPVLVGARPDDYSADWYADLKRPRFAAPDSVFPIVFLLFYLTEGIGVWLVLKTVGIVGSMPGLLFFLAGTILSALWSRIFFINRRCDRALLVFVLEIPCNWLACYAFFQVNGLAGILLLPISIWASYAIFVNLGLYKLNLAFWDANNNTLFD